MEQVYIYLENCYGISKFEHTFTFDDKRKAYLIYAPNGVMKTSFANTMNDICNSKITKDCFYPTRSTIRKVKYNDAEGEDLSKNNILVIQPYSEKYKSDNQVVLLADQGLKKKYDDIHTEIAEKMKEVFLVISNLSGKRNSGEMLSKDFGFNSKEIYECLEKLYDEVSEDQICDYSQIKYGKLFTPDTEKILSDPDIISALNEYIEQYEHLLTQSTIFKASFNHTNAEDSLKALEKSGFFKANHKVLLFGAENAIGNKDFKTAIDNEKRRILNQELSVEFNRIDQLLSAKIVTKDLREFIFMNKEIIPELININEFKKKLWIAYLYNQKTIFEEAVLNYKNNKAKLKEVIAEAKEQKSKWNEVVKQFNERFNNLPFRIEIENKDDVVLKSQLPTIKFKYKSRGEETFVDEQELLLHLSNGEKKALYLLNIIFEIEARKVLAEKTLLIIDDIADSFDYRNKYAIIEYIKEIADSSLFMPIILTHNFDFYRTVAGRVGIKTTSDFVQRNTQGIKLIHGQYFENVFDKWRDKVYRNNCTFISSISFIRNLVEYVRGREDDCYLNLTSLLHYKKNSKGSIKATKQIKVSDLIGCYEREWQRDKAKFTQDGKDLVIDLINTTADELALKTDESVFIEEKIVLAIACRLKAEQYMIERIGNDEVTDNIEGNQTRQLRDSISFNTQDQKDIIIEEIIERVLIITSENIHINSFMYEPIVDMSIQELIKLYKDINSYLCG